MGAPLESFISTMLLCVVMIAWLRMSCWPGGGFKVHLEAVRSIPISWLYDNLTSCMSLILGNCPCIVLLNDLLTLQCC